MLRSSVRLFSTARPFKVLGLQQIAIGGASKADLSSLWVDVFGCTKTGTFRSERENVDEDILTLGKGAFAVEVDLMQPINPDKVRACLWEWCRRVRRVVQPPASGVVTVVQPFFPSRSSLAGETWCFAGVSGRHLHRVD